MFGIHFSFYFRSSVRLIISYNFAAPDGERSCGDYVQWNFCETFVKGGCTDEDDSEVRCFGAFVADK